jgi:transcriptional regulator with XRE-family HTH domain
MGFIRQVGLRLREEREKSGMSLQKLASKSGVSAGTIYKIEVGKLVPSIAIFLKIVKSLNKKVSFFLDERNDIGEISLIRSKDRKISHFSKFNIGSIPPGIINAQMSGNIFFIQQGGESGKTPLSHPGEEIIFIIDGTLELKIREESFILRKGDSIQFHCKIPHRWKNLGKKGTVAIQICTPPVPV